MVECLHLRLLCVIVIRELEVGEEGLETSAPLERIQLIVHISVLEEGREGECIRWSI